MAPLLWPTRIAIIVILLVVSCMVLSSMANQPPVISMGIPYTKRKGVLALSEDTPSNSILALLEVKDDDTTGADGIVECTTDNAYVGILLAFPKTYKVQLLKELDRETVNSILVSIQCSDKGTPPLTTTATFTIEIMDINDNRPVFTKAVFNAIIKEGLRIGTLVTRVKATDPDVDLNGVLEYSIQEDVDSNFTYFTIDKESGRIYTSHEIDREAISEFNLTVVAKDSGLPSHSASAQVRVEVEDVNDNAPVILTKQLRTNENDKPMSVVGIIHATDADTGKNSELVFSKLEDSESSSQAPFLIHPNGEVLAAVSLDREQKAEYSMDVLVRDKGNPRLSSSVTIAIFVDDVNDNPPLFISDCLTNDFYDDFSYDIENNETRSLVTIDWFSPADDRLVYKVEAEDEDSAENKEIRYAIEAATINKNISIASNKEPLFQIDSISGEITLRRFVHKYDPLIQYVNISATDRGVPALSSYCLLSITIDVDPSLLSIPRTDTFKPVTRERNTLTNNGAVNVLTCPAVSVLRLWALPVVILFARGWLY